MPSLSIFFQGNLREKDFDIRKEAGEKSLTAVIKEYVAPVTENFLEIHFFWAGKGTCCVPTQGYYGGSISAISVDPYGKATLSEYLAFCLACYCTSILFSFLFFRFHSNC